MTESVPSPSPEWLAQQYGPLVFKAAYRVLGDASLAEDVQQDVFLKLIESDPVEVGSWPAYLSASAVRTAIRVPVRLRVFSEGTPPQERKGFVITEHLS